MANERKTQIIKAAAKRFARHGLTKTTLDEIARDLRIGKASIYHYFKSKEELFYETIDWEVSRFISEIKFIFNDETIDLRERFAAYFLLKENLYTDFRMIYDLLILLLRDDTFEREKTILTKLLKLEEDILKLVFSSLFSSKIESVNPALPSFFVYSSWGLLFGKKIGNLVKPDKPSVTKDLLIKSIDLILE